MNIPNTTKRHGFGLIEVTISTLLVSLLLIGSLTAIGSLEKSREIDCDTGIAANIANKVITEFLANPYSDLTGTSSDTSGVIPDIATSIRDSLPNNNGEGEVRDWNFLYSVDYVQDDLISLSDSDTGIKRLSVEIYRYGNLIKTVRCYTTSNLD